MMMPISMITDFLRLRRQAALPQRKVQTLQQKKLRDILQFSYEHSPYYHRIFEAAGITVANIRTVPITQFPTLDKETLIRNFDELVTDPEISQCDLARFDAEEKLSQKQYRGNYHLVHSSGSTGLPRYFLYDDAAWSTMLQGIIRGALWGMSFPELIGLLCKRPRILYLAAVGGRYGGAMAVGDGIDGLGARQMQLDINTPLAQWKKTIQDFSPDVLIGYSSALKILAQLKQQGELELDVKRVVTCGEPLPGRLRCYLQEVFRAPVVNFYGASESLALGVETDPNEGMYLFDDLNFVEWIDGQMYITCLYNRIQPLIRYRLTDTLVLREADPTLPCPFTRIDAVEGRDEDILWFCDENGRREFLHPLSVEGICVEGLIDYQIRQTAKDAFELAAETVTGTSDANIFQGIGTILQPILQEKGLDFVRYSIRFERIFPNPRTGKKPLMVAMPAAGEA